MQVACHSFPCIANTFVAQVSKGVYPGLDLLVKMRGISYFDNKDHSVLIFSFKFYVNLKVVYNLL